MSSNYRISAYAKNFAALRSRPTVLALLFRLIDLRRSRRSLARLDAAQLNDVGVSPEAAEREARRAAWDVPQSWLTRP